MDSCWMGIGKDTRSGDCGGTREDPGHAWGKTLRRIISRKLDINWVKTREDPGHAWGKTSGQTV